MAWYKLCDLPDASRTSDYSFSVIDKSDEQLLAIKEDVRRHNAWIRRDVRDYAKEVGAERALRYMESNPLQRVRLMARGPRAMYARLEGLYPRTYDSFIPHKYAKYFDVYRGSDSHAMYHFRDQIQNGITPGQQKLINDLQMAQWDLQNKNLGLLRKAGIRTITDRNGTRYVGIDT